MKYIVDKLNSNGSDDGSGGRYQDKLDDGCGYSDDYKFKSGYAHGNGYGSGDFDDAVGGHGYGCGCGVGYCSSDGSGDGAGNGNKDDNGFSYIYNENVKKCNSYDKSLEHGIVLFWVLVHLFPWAMLLGSLYLFGHK